VLGLAVAPLALDALLALAPPSLPRIEAMGVDGSVIAITLATCLLLGLGVAIGPALNVARRPVWTGLRTTGPRAGGGRDASRVRSVLVTVQVALSLILLVGAGLLARSMAALLRVDPGFNANGVLTLRVPLSGADYPDAASAAAFHRTLRDRLGALPGVRQAGAIDALPLASGTNQTAVSFPGAPGNSGDASLDRPLIDWFRASPDWFASLGIEVIDGRAIDSRDQAESAPVAVIDETLARRFYPSSSPVGQSMVWGGDTVSVIGVARHARFYNVFQDDRGLVWVPATQSVAGSMYYALRTDRDPMALVGAVRSTVRELDASIPLTDVRPMTAVVRASLGQHQLSLVLIGGFALGALVLAVMGIYGVVANSVVRRTHEFGVRLALGAERRGIVALALRSGVRVIAVGLVIGVVAALFASRMLESLLFGLRAGDPLTFTGVVTLLAAVGLLACLIPGWRAARIPPAEALRTE
jgi:predicted permease